MKKLIAIVLIIVMSASIAACGNNSSNTTTASSSATSSSTSTSKKNPDVDPTKAFDKVNETVYVTTDSLNVRTSPEFPDDNGNIFKSFDYGEELLRVGYNETWSKLLIDGTEYFASSKYLTTSKIVTEFDEVTETVYIVGIDTIRVRSKTSLDDEISTTVAYLSRGTEITRMGIAFEEDGEGILWSYVEFLLEDESGNLKPAEGYINSKYLSTEPEEIITPDIDVQFNEQIDTLVVLADSLNLRKYPKLEDASLSGKSASKGNELARIGIASETDEEGITWSIVIFEGHLYYISSNPSYTKVTEEPTTTSTTLSLFDKAYSITLPTHSFIASEEGTQIYIGSLNDVISVAYSGDLGEVEMSAVEYARAIAQIVAASFGLDSIEVLEKDGLVYFAFAYSLEGEAYYSLVIVSEGLGNDFYLTTFEGAGTEADLAEKYFAYADTIKIEAPKTE